MDSPTGDRMQNQQYREATDDQLVEVCQSGDQAAFEELVKRYQSPAFKVAVSIVRDREDAEDEVQNAFWKAYQHINQFNQDSKFSTWLTRIVVNQCLMRLRRLRRVKFSYLDEGQHMGEEAVTLQVKDYRQSPEAAVGQNQVAQVLNEEIRKTPPLLRHVFVLREVQQLPMPEVAKTLGITVPAAKSRLLRARAELRKRMRRHYGQIGPAVLMG